MSKNVLITGGAGFVGSNLAIQLKEKYPQYNVFAFDNLKRRGAELNLPRLKFAGVEFFHGDIRNPEDFDVLPKIDVLIEASAEPSVLAGIKESPNYLINTNLLGTVNCLNFSVKNSCDFIFLSTNRVYPIEKIEQINFVEEETRFSISEKQSLTGVSVNGISESFSLEGYRSIYGATKLSSELLIQEYGHFFNLRTVINRCSVLTGPWQMGKVDQGVVVLWMYKHFWGQKLSYMGYGGQGKQLRDILHINDFFSLIDWEIHHIENISNQVFNVGGGAETTVSLCELTKLCRKITGKEIEISSITENRTADIRIYVTDNKKVASITGWKPKISVEEILLDVYNWLVANQNQLAEIFK